MVIVVYYLIVFVVPATLFYTRVYACCARALDCLSILTLNVLQRNVQQS